MGVHVFNASVTLRDGALSNGSINVTASEVHADGAAGGPARALVFSANLVQLTVKVFKETKCLGEGSCSLLIEGTVKADGPLNVEKIHASINNTTIAIQDELYQFVQKQKKYKPASIRKDVICEDHIATLIPRLSPVIPKIFSLRIDTTTVKCIDNITKTNFKISLQSLHVSYIIFYYIFSYLLYDRGRVYNLNSILIYYLELGC
ncbi:unnamed protein product [Diatraea saccharalis]|uniref:Uncharacterized protein n=1 Tax=Diatraea saccharalis TaxID=40085 RepID=A0A9N9W7X7_9NEOP|nr:unnamed protein product [Diatraea saccharalis]